MENQIIRAAGAIIWRRLDEDLIQIALIHRPRYDDWSFPKGKVEEGESEIACAHREILEETGFQTKFGAELCLAEYPVGEITKTVRYWSAEVIGESTGPHDSTEVDQLIWVTLEDGYSKLTRPGDKDVLRHFERVGVDTIPLILLRHGKAVAREEWEGDDGDRPLAQLGQVQAKRLLSMYQPYGVTEIHSSDAVRCYETVAPMARALDLNVVYWRQLSEYAFEKDEKAAIEVVREIIETEAPSIICGHNPVIPEIVGKLIGKKSFKKFGHELLPGEAWILHHRDGQIVAIDWMQAPSN